MTLGPFGPLTFLALTLLAHCIRPMTLLAHLTIALYSVPLALLTLGLCDPLPCCPLDPWLFALLAL